MPLTVQTLMPVPGLWVISVQHQYRYRTLRYVWYDINAGTGPFGTLGATSEAVPDTSVNSLQPKYLVPLPDTR